MSPVGRNVQSATRLTDSWNLINIIFFNSFQSLLLLLLFHVYSNIYPGIFITRRSKVSRAILRYNNDRFAREIVFESNRERYVIIEGEVCVRDRIYVEGKGRREEESRRVVLEPRYEEQRLVKHYGCNDAL